MAVFVILAVLSKANAGTVVYPYSRPPSGYTFSYDLNQPGPTITCIGYSNSTGTPFQQNTQWTVTLIGGSTQTITSSSAVFGLSQEPSVVGGVGQTNLTVLNVTNGLDGAVVACSIIVSGIYQPIATFLFKVYRAPVLRIAENIVKGINGSSVTFQVADLASLPPYPTPFQTVIGSGSLSASQLKYNHPNLTLTGLTEDNSGSYVVTATNYRLIDGTIIGSSSASLNLNVLFPPVITNGPSFVASILGQPTSLVCGTNLRSNPPSSIAWRDSSEATVTNGGRFVFGSGSDRIHLNISNTTLSDNGTWRCILNNGILAPLTWNISLFIFVPPSQPYNITSLQDVSDNHTQLHICWRTPSFLGVPPLSVYHITASSPMDTNYHNMELNNTCTLFSDLLPGLSYDITVIALSIFGSISGPSSPSDRIAFSTIPSVPTIMCRNLFATSGNVNVSWIVVYNGGRDITTFEVGYALSGSRQEYRPIQTSVQPNATFVIAKEQFVSSMSYMFKISASNIIGISNAIACGPVLLNEGIPLHPDTPTVTSNKAGTVTMTLSTAASGAGNTGTFAFIITSVPTVDTMPLIYSFPMYVDQQKVSVVINNIKDGIVYTFVISASNVFGSSESVNVTWLSNDSTSGLLESVIGAVTGGLIVLLLLTVGVAICFIRLHQSRSPLEDHKNAEPVELSENKAYDVVLYYKADNININEKTTDLLELQENKAYGMVHVKVNPTSHVSTGVDYENNPAHRGEEAVSMEENTAYRTITATEYNGKSTYETIGTPQRTRKGS